MPIYEYRCESCGTRFDRLFLSSNQMPSEMVCPACHSDKVRRLFSPPAIHTAGQGGGDRKEEEAPPPKPPVFGRKELNEILKSREQEG